MMNNDNILKTSRKVMLSIISWCFGPKFAIFLSFWFWCSSSNPT